MRIGCTRGRGWRAETGNAVGTRTGRRGHGVNRDASGLRGEKRRVSLRKSPAAGTARPAARRSQPPAGPGPDPQRRCWNPHVPAPSPRIREPESQIPRPPSPKLSPFLGPEPRSPPRTCLQRPRRSPVSLRGAVVSTASTRRRCSRRRPGAGGTGGASRHPHPDPPAARSREAAPAPRLAHPEPGDGVRGRTEAGPPQAPPLGRRPAPSEAPPRPRLRPWRWAEIPSET